MSDLELVTTNCGAGAFVGVEVVGLGELPACGLGWNPCGMNREGAPPETAFAGL